MPIRRHRRIIRRSVTCARASPSEEKIKDREEIINDPREGDGTKTEAASQLDSYQKELERLKAQLKRKKRKNLNANAKPPKKKRRWKRPGRNVRERARAGLIPKSRCGRSGFGNLKRPSTG